MIHCWIADASGAREVPADEAVRAASAGEARAWIDFEGDDEATVQGVLGPLGVHPVAIEDMVRDVNRPKVDDYGEYLYLVMHSARWDGSRPRLREIDLLVCDRFLVTYHDGSRSIAEARTTLMRRPDLLAQHPARLLHHILDVLVDRYLPIMDRVSEEIDALEEGLLGSGDVDTRSRLLPLKRGMSALRRIVGPQRDTVLALTRDEFRAIPPEMRPYLRDVYDRMARVSDLLDSFRDETATLIELDVARTSNRLNEVIKRLTVIATIGLPLTVVTSYYGMNFDFPEYKLRQPGLFALGLLAVTALGTWWYLKRRRWM